MKIAICSIIFIIGIVIAVLLQLLGSYFCRDKEHSNVFICEHCKAELNRQMFIPVVGFFITKGRCNSCKNKTISCNIWIQILTGVTLALIYFVKGISIESAIYCLLTLILIVITIVDFAIYEIPIELNIAILTLGIFNSVVDIDNIVSHIIGFFAISLPIYLLIWISNGKAMGGGDCRLMAVAGLLMGWKLVIFAFFAGCIFGSIIHSIRIKVSNEEHRLAFGPYLALGIFVSLLYGNDIINWYLSFI